MPNDVIKALIKMQEETAQRLANMQKEIAIVTAREFADALVKANDRQAELHKSSLTIQQEIFTVLAKIKEDFTKLSSRLDDVERRLATPTHKDPSERPET
jgi:hypothetical protein